MASTPTPSALEGPRLPRVDVLGVGISAVSVAAALAEVARWVEEGERHYVCVTGVHGVMESHRSERLRAIHNASGLTIPDGAPMLWACRHAGFRDTERMRGSDFMLAVLGLAARHGWSNFFYGAAEGTAQTLASRLGERFPGLRVAGTHSPPFRALSAAERVEDCARINDSGADLVWVGLSTPKQERWMADCRPDLNAAAMFGVGMAFDVHAGLLDQAPVLVQRSGFEWLYRLANDPRRLWRRYLRNNPEFVAALLRHPPRPMPPNR